MNDEASMILKEKKRKATSNTTTALEATRIIPDSQISNLDVLSGRGPVSFNHGEYFSLLISGCKIMAVHMPNA